jgi:phosphoserine phosphatase
MFTATALTSPAAPALTGALLAPLRNAWGGGEIRWLAPGEAAEFDLPVRPGNFDQVRSELQAMKVDLCLQPAEGRRKALLLADMDSTVIGQECIDELADMAGVGAEVKAVTARAMNGELDFEDALRSRVALLAGQDAAIVERVLAERITLTPGGPELLATMKANGAYAALVSGGFTAFAEPIAARLGFDEARANRLLVEDGRLTGRVGEPILGRDAKLAALQELAAALPGGTASALAVGDGANDLAMLRRAGAGVALHAKPVVAAECDLRINFGDLTALLYLQGYARDEFVTP